MKLWLFRRCHIAECVIKNWNEVLTDLFSLIWKPPLPLLNLWPVRRNPGSEKWVRLVWKPWIEQGQQALQITQKRHHSCLEATQAFTRHRLLHRAPRLALTLTLWAELLYEYCNTIITLNLWVENLPRHVVKKSLKEDQYYQNESGYFTWIKSIICVTDMYYWSLKRGCSHCDICLWVIWSSHDASNPNKERERCKWGGKEIKPALFHSASQEEGKKNSTTADHLYRGLDPCRTPLRRRKVSPALRELAVKCRLLTVNCG